MLELIKKHKIRTILVLLLIVFDSFVISLALIKSNKEITTPGGLNKVESVIQIDNGISTAGSFNTIYVYSIDDATLLQTYIASLAPYNEVSDKISSVDLTKDELTQSGKIQKNQSIEGSLICAYNYANKYFDEDIKITYSFIGFIVYYYQVNQTAFQMGDIIYQVKVNETNKIVDYKNPQELAKTLNNIKPKDVIYFLRGEEEIPYEVEKEISSDNMNRFSAYAKYQIVEEETFPKYTLHKGNTLGPSGGLLQTLSVYSQITGIDLTYGKTICGTGTISVDGTVGAIGGISQKITTAIRNDADIFLCPSVHYEEAMETYYKTKGHEKMTVISVSTFEEAVSALMNLGENNDY